MYDNDQSIEYGSTPEGGYRLTTKAPRLRKRTEAEDFADALRAKGSGIPMISHRAAMQPKAGPDMASFRPSPAAIARSRYAAALKPRFAFGSGAMHYEIADQAMGDPYIQQALPKSSQMVGGPSGPQESASDFARFAREQQARKLLQYGG